METADDKLSFLAGAALSSLSKDRIEPSNRGDWINHFKNEWDDLLPIADKNTKASKKTGQDRAIFKLFSQGIKTNRDDGVIGLSKDDVAEKVRALLRVYVKPTTKDRKSVGEGKRVTDRVDLGGERRMKKKK